MSGVTLTEIAAARRTVTVTWSGFSIDVTYRMSERTFAAQAKDAEWLDRLVALIDTWDITRDDGTAAPVTRKTLDKLPVPLLLAISTAIGEDDGVGEALASSDAG